MAHDFSVLAARVARIIGVFVLTAAPIGCGSERAKSPADATDDCGPEDDVERGADTAIEGAKTGATTAWEGTKTFGKSAGGLVTGGSDEAKGEWKEGSEETRETARKGRADTKRAARTKKCR